MDLLGNIKYLFLGLLTGGAIVITISFLTLLTTRLSRRFPNSYLLKLSSFLSSLLSGVQGTRFPVFSVKLLPGCLTILVSLVSGFVALSSILSSWLPYLLTGLGVIIGIFIAVNIRDIFKEFRDN